MKTVIIELTDHCNLSCRHCFSKRHNASGFIQKEVVAEVLNGARDSGFEHISFTGGEPTLHPHFGEILELTFLAGYRFGIVSNGWNFSSIHALLLPFKESLTSITFSLDGASETTHDYLRGKGSFLRLIKAFEICNSHDMPFTINTVLTARNIQEISHLANMVMKCGGNGLRFGHLLPAPRSVEENLVLASHQQKKVEAAIDELANNLSMPVVLAPGHYTTDLIPCAALKMQEVNVNWQGSVTFCCHLSGQFSENGNDEIGNLPKMNFSKALELVNETSKNFLKTKISCYAKGLLKESDYFPCSYCTEYFKKMSRNRE